jgi:hypothetical protein
MFDGPAFNQQRRQMAKKEKKEKAPERLYKCDKCEATFTDPEMLEKHRKTHNTAGMQGQMGEGEPALQGQPRTPPSSPPPGPMPTTGAQPG